MPDQPVAQTELRIRYAIASAICLAAGVAVLVYAGPGRSFVRGILGDVLVVPFLYFGCGVFFPHARKVRAIGVGALAVGLEALQLLELAGPDSPWWLRLVLGTTFDPLDLLAYAVGLAAAFAIDVRLLTRR